MKKENIENETDIGSGKNIKNVLNELEASKNEIKKNWELFVRAKAEVENIKKRAEKEIININKYSQKKIFIDILPVLDSLESCLTNNDNKHKKDYDGTKLLYKMLLSILNKYYVTRMTVDKYKILDPFKHEVISIINDEIHDNKIESVYQNGYMLHNQIIRYAKVSIFKKNEV